MWHSFNNKGSWSARNLGEYTQTISFKGATFKQRVKEKEGARCIKTTEL